MLLEVYSICIIFPSGEGVLLPFYINSLLHLYRKLIYADFGVFCVEGPFWKISQQLNTNVYQVLSKSIQLHFFIPTKLMSCRKNHYSWKWHHPSCTCVKILTVLGHNISRLLLLECRYVVNTCQIFIFKQDHWDIVSSFPGKEQPSTCLTGSLLFWLGTV